MKPRRIILVRHGESEANVKLFAYGQTSGRLIRFTKAGCVRASELGGELYRGRGWLGMPQNIIGGIR